jgi:DNA invertase Pin-like site-specific DNA recombinase
MMSVFAQLERELIGVRTREALKVKKSQGVKLGRPVTMAADLSARIVAMRNAGETFQTIADTFNAENLPTARGGGKWYPSTVAKVASRCGNFAA